MKVSTIRIPCKNLQIAEKYYSEKLGLHKIFGSVSDEFIGYQLQNVQLLLEHEEIGQFESGRYLGFSLEVDDINRFYETSKNKGVIFTTAPEKQPWGGTMTHIEDCSKNTFSIIQK